MIRSCFEYFPYSVDGSDFAAKAAEYKGVFRLRAQPANEKHHFNGGFSRKTLNVEFDNG
jgi:hypothetical protein